jgi:hypothetical protein
VNDGVAVSAKFQSEPDGVRSLSFPQIDTLIGISALWSKLVRRGMTCLWSVPALRVFLKEEIHTVTDAIAELSADPGYSIDPGDQGVANVWGQRICDVESLLEYAHQCGEVAEQEPCVTV